MLASGFYNMDCMEGMRQFPDKYFELCICDPPYGIGVARHNWMTYKDDGEFDRRVKAGRKVRGQGKALPKQYAVKEWDCQTPDSDYFTELFRVSKNQIVWGGNYFIEFLTNTSCMIVWDKDNSGDFADCEIAWTSFDSAVRKFVYRWNGMLQENMKDKEERIHPTQKPIALYKWLLTNYAHKGDKILDTHVGSASSLIACHQLGFEYWGFELDADYYKAASERLERAKAQVGLLDILPEEKPEQMRL